MRLRPYRASLMRRLLLLVPLGALAYAAFFSWFAVNRHDAFMTHTADLGQIDLAVWNTSQGRFVQEIKGDQVSTRLTDHVEPVFWPISVLLHAWDDVRVLLIAQSAAIALAALPVFAFVALAPGRGSRRLGYAVAGGWAAAAYLLAPQGQAATLADLHAAPFAALPLALLLYLGQRHKTWPALAMAVLALAVKEEIALVVGFAGLYLAITRAWRPGWLIIALAAVWFVVATFAIIPHYSRPVYGAAGSPYLARYGDADQEPETAAGTERGVLRLALRLVERDRLRYYLGLLAAFAFMPLLAPELALVAAPLIAANAGSNYGAMYSGELHYSAPFLSLLACAAGVGARRLLRYSWDRGPAARWLAMTPLLALPLAYQVLEGYTPLGAEFRLNRLPVSSHQHLLERFAAQIPRAASLSTTPALHPHFSHRRLIYTFPSLGGADYVLLDVSGTTDMHPADIRSGFDRLLASGYGVADSADGCVLLRRSVVSEGLSPAFFDFAHPDRPPQHLLDVSYGASLRLVGYDWLDDPKRGYTRLRLHWQALAPLDADLAPYAILADTDGNALLDSRQVPFLEPYWYPLDRWLVGETVTTTTVAAPLGDAFEGYVGVVVGGDYADPAARLPLALGSGESSLPGSRPGLLRLPPVQRSSNRFDPSLLPFEAQPAPRGFRPLHVTFGNALQLRSAWLDNRTVHPGDSLRLRTRWSRLAPVAAPLAASLRLLDARAEVVAQVDGPFHGALYPPEEWPLVAVVGGSSTLTVPTGSPAGEYTLAMLVYRRDTLQPLTTPDGSSLVELAQVRVLRREWEP